MQSTPDYSPLDEEANAAPDDFDRVLRALARPDDVAQGIEANLPRGLGHPLESPVEQALRDAAHAHEPRPGDVLDGRYRIVRVLGRGGMGVVLEAEQLRTQKRVAIKWMSAARGEEKSAAQVARFLREARAVANIQHPNVVDLYDVGDSGGVPFLVLERLHGESLRTRLTRGVLPSDEMLPILHGVLHGVAAVHRAGIVHRDLKPDNIFLCQDGGVITPKVLDFGVAAMRITTQDGLASLTRTGALLGTPAYMALEQLTGGSVDARADIYALGVMLYEMLTGRLPFEARSAPELAVLLATQEPTPPTKFVRSLPRALEGVILRALARKPEARFGDVAAFAHALDQSMRPARRARGAIVSGVVLAALTLAVAATWRTPAREAAASKTAARPAPKATDLVVTRPSAPSAIARPAARRAQPAALVHAPTLPAQTPSAGSPADAGAASDAPRTRRIRPIAAEAARSLPENRRAATPAPYDETAIHLDDF